MSQENVDVVVKQFEDTNARDFLAAMSAYSDDVTLIPHGKLAALERVMGKAAVGEWLGDWFRQFGPDYRFDIEQALDAGDRVFIVATHHGQGRRSGVTVENRIAYVYTVHHGLISRMEIWDDEDRSAALEAAGLRE